MILIIANTDFNSGFNFFKNETFTIFDCIEIYRRKEDVSNIAKKDFEEYYADEIVKAIDLKYNSKIEAIIDKHLDPTNFGRAILIAGHIATHQYSNSALDKLPVIISSWSEIMISELKEVPISNFFSVQGVFAKTYAELFQIVKSATGEQEYKITQFLRKNRTAVQWQDFKINYSFDDRHQIANEWGALKLALNAGYSKEDIKYDWPPTLYFKYLLKKHKSQFLSKGERLSILNSAMFELGSMVSAESLHQDGKLRFSNHPYLKNKKVLLIDDNADKGWEVILENIFSGSIFDVKNDFEQVNQFGNLLDINKYDLVFLDLRLPKILLKDVQLDYGIDLLDKLKFTFPHIPIIVFTASNKSWTLYEVSEKGADGMYVKESPEYAGDEKYSKENFESFVKTVLKCLDSYFILRPYWEKIVEIKENFLPEINDNELDKKFKSRIEERLEMFYGLLKRGMGQRKYDQERFYFSDYELAFMTLWSTLNEISEAYFLKTQPSIQILDFKNNSLSTHPGGSPIRYLNISDGRKHFLWKIKSQQDVYVEYEYNFVNDGNDNPKSNGHYYSMNHNQLSPFEFSNNRFALTPSKRTIINYEKTLFMQIAFLLEKKSEFCGSINKAQYQQNIARLNDIRNKLYLTHGSDIGSIFYKFTESEKRGFPNWGIAPQHSINPLKDIKALFELVAFLLTGKEMELNF